MQPHRQPRVGDIVRLIRSGHAPGSPERATVVAIHGSGTRKVLRVRWCEGHDTFVPLDIARR
jgi:hypothetical protein